METKSHSTTGRTIGIAAIVLTVVLIMYVLSCGPMFAVYTNDYITFRAYSRVYYPVFLVVHKTNSLDLFNWYVNKWDSWIGGNGVPQSTYEDAT